MKRHLLATAVVTGTLFAASAAFAADASGTIESWDDNANTITLTDGTTYELGADVQTEGLTAGSDIDIVYEEKDGKREASSITVRK